LHGNVDTRLRRLDAGETDALVLACAGLDRIGLTDRIVERLEPALMPPAPGQGAIAVQIRSDDARSIDIVAAIDDMPTRLAVAAERRFLSASGGGCRAPIGALAMVIGEQLELLVGIVAEDGSDAAFARCRVPLADGEALAMDLARQLGSATRIRSSAGDVVGGERPTPAPRVLVTRAAGQEDELVAALRRVGLDPIGVPTIAIEFEGSAAEVAAAVRLIDTYRWVVVTSANGARAILGAGNRSEAALGSACWAAIGPATRQVLEGAGIEVAFQPSSSSGMAMALELPVVTGDRVLVIRGDLADRGVLDELRARGADVDGVIAYRTREAPESSRELLRMAVAAGPIRAAVLTSGSTIRGLVSLGRAAAVDLSSIAAACIGPKTADEARAAGFSILAVSPTPDAAALAAATRTALVTQLQET
jgi:hydroxymethylbilane synthase